MSEHDLLLIEKYYRSELTEVERSAFEQRLEKDVEFREEANLHELAMGAVHQHGRDLFKKQLNERPRIKKIPGNRFWLWTGFVGVALLLICISFYLYRNKSQTLPIPPTGVPTEESIPNGDQKIAPQETTDPIVTTPDLKPDTEKLFAKAFGPYKDGSVRSTQHSYPDTSKVGSIDRLRALVVEEKFSESLEEYDRLPKALQAKEGARFFKAYSLLALGRADEASILFEGIASNPNTNYSSLAQWYAALCALKQKDLAKAKKWLLIVTAKENNTSDELRKDAGKLLKELQ